MNQFTKFRVDGGTEESSTPTIPSKPIKAILPIQPKFKGRIIAFDQSISNTGWVYLTSDPESGLKLIDAGNIKTDPVAKGHEDTLLRGELIHDIVLDKLRSWYWDSDPQLPHLCANEAPPVSGARMMRPESSLVSAHSCRLAVRQHVPRCKFVFVGSQRVKFRLTGKRDAEKREVMEALRRLLPHIQIKNQAIADALGVGVVASEENVREP